MKNYFKKAFTLAEILIVLAVIGIITAILLPAARNITPDENVLKFKKAHNAFYTAIKELVTSDTYYLDGDLGMMPNGNLIYDEVNNDWEKSCKYFCSTLTDVITTKSVNCTVFNSGHSGAVDLRTGEMFDNNFCNQTCSDVTQELMQKSKIHLDTACKEHIGEINDSSGFKNADNQIITPDNSVWYEINSYSSFAFSGLCGSERIRRFSPPNEQAKFCDLNGFDAVYKVFCIDIDGINKGEDPFGYGIRADGKILNGARADEWLNKSIQQN